MKATDFKRIASELRSVYVTGVRFSCVLSAKGVCSHWQCKLGSVFAGRINSLTPCIPRDLLRINALRNVNTHLLLSSHKTTNELTTLVLT